MKPTSWMLLTTLVFAAACADDSKSSGTDAGTDSGDTDNNFPRAPRALIIDQELRHHSTWIDVIDAFLDAGITPEYRRFYPHITDADVEPEDSEYPYEIIVFGAGRSPGNPSSLARLDDIDAMRRFVENGGALLLAPQPGWEDSGSGANDFFVQNRLLEELDVPVRVDRNTILGAIWNGAPAPPHEETEFGYPTPLEFVLGYPYLLTTDDEPLAGSAAPTLRVASVEVQVLLRTNDVSYLWYEIGGSSNFSFNDEQRAVATLAEAGDGFVAVVPRGPLTISAASGVISDKPALDPMRQAANREWVAELVVSLRDLVRGDAEFEVTVARDSDTLFSVGASNCPALSPDGEVVEIVGAVSDLTVPETPPPGDLVEDVPPTPADSRPVPPWFSSGGGRIAYGWLPPQDDDMALAFTEIVDHEIDALMTSTDPSLLVTLEGEELDAQRARYAAISALAEDAGARWIVGDWFYSPAGSYPAMVGAHGYAADIPAPLNADYWNEVVIPIYDAVGKLAADNPGLAGLHLDLELYNGPVWHHDGWAFSDDTLEFFLDGFADTSLAEELRNTAAGKRLDVLVDHGLLGDYFAALEQAAYEIGCACREAARSWAPDLELTVYLAGFPNTWFYQGLLRGLGTHDRPVIAMTYEGWGDRPTEALYAEGVEWVHLGGAIVGHFLPDDLDDVLVSLAAGNDGYWYYSFNDFSMTNPEPPDLHGDGVEYWAAVDAANSQF